MGTVVKYSRIRERRPERAPPLRTPKPPVIYGRRQGKNYAFVALLLSAAFLGFAYFQRMPLPSEMDAIHANFTMCRDKDTRNCVIDGDTFRYKGREVRIANLDAPEIFSPDCTAERARGVQAKQELLYQLNKGPFQLVRTGLDDKDVYGRDLRLVLRDGQSLSEVLVSKGVARQWPGRDQSWCG